MLNSLPEIQGSARRQEELGPLSQQRGSPLQSGSIYILKVKSFKISSWMSGGEERFRERL